MSEERTNENGEDIAEQGGRWPVDRLKPLLEALLFAAADPLPARKVCEIVEGATTAEVKATLKELSTDLLTHGIRVVEVSGGWQLRTAPEHHRYVRKLFRERPFRVTRAATETLAIVAYNQPATRIDIESIRGVESGGVLESLVEKRLLKIVGRKDVPGRPLLYSTTGDFLELFGLKNLRDMPTLAELGDDIERMADETGFRETGSEETGVLPFGDGEDGSQDEHDAGSLPAEQESGNGEATHSDAAADEAGVEVAGDREANEEESEEGSSEPEPAA